MKTYKLLRDLPTFKAGDMFYINESGNLCAENTQGHRELVAYMKSTLEKFPNILKDWFEEVGEIDDRVPYGDKYWYIGAEGDLITVTEVHLLDDDNKFAIGNYFKTEEEAERALAKMKAYMIVKRDAKGFNPKADEGKWCVCLLTSPHRKTWITIDYTIFEKHCGVVYFATEEDARASLKIHRKEWELLFDLEEE